MRNECQFVLVRRQHSRQWDGGIRCIFGQNLELLTSISGDLSRGQTHRLKMGLILTLKWNLTLKVTVSHPQNNRDRNYLWSKFGDSSLNGWWVIARTNLVTDGRTDWRTDGQTQATTIPGGQNWPRVKRHQSPITGLLVEKVIGDQLIPDTKVINAESVSMSWRHNGKLEQSSRN